VWLRYITFKSSGVLCVQGFHELLVCLAMFELLHPNKLEMIKLLHPKGRKEIPPLLSSLSNIYIKIEVYPHVSRHDSVILSAIFGLLASSLIYT